MSLKMFDLAGAAARYRFRPYCWRVRMALFAIPRWRSTVS